MKNTAVVAVTGISLILPSVLLAATPDWSKVPATDVTIFYPGASPIEWVTKGTAHGGARMLKRGETCAGCHSEEAADMGVKLVTGQKNEPTPIKGKAGSIPVRVQSAFDGEHIYFRFTWKQPAASGAAKRDAKNPVKLAVMMATDKVEMANQSGCWQACHSDARTMPDGKDDKKTKYIAGANLAGGVFYDLIQWRSNEPAVDGHVAETRVMSGGKALVSAVGKQTNGEWEVVFTRKLKGGEGDVALEAGKTYNIGFAVHDDHADGRFHHVSLGYTLGLGVDADIKAVK